jgi:hypothetical protein
MNEKLHNGTPELKMTVYKGLIGFVGNSAWAGNCWHRGFDVAYPLLMSAAGLFVLLVGGLKLARYRRRISTPNA